MLRRLLFYVLIWVVATQMPSSWRPSRIADWPIFWSKDFRTWTELKSKREALSSSVQMYDSSNAYVRNGDRARKFITQLETRGDHWRESTFDAQEPAIRVFNGKEFLLTQGSEHEFVRKKHDDEMPLIEYPIFYDWKGIHLGGPRPCDFRMDDRVEKRECFSFQLKERSFVFSWAKPERTMEVLVERQTGVIVSLRYRFENSRFFNEKSYVLSSFLTKGVVPEARFALAPATREVERLSYRQSLPPVRRMSRQLNTSEKKLIGELAPNLEVWPLKGKSLELSSFKGREVLLDFWGSWCPPCREDHPALEKVYRERHAAGLEVLAVSSEKPKPVREFLAQHPTSFQVGMAPRELVTKAYAVDVVPTYVLIGKDGRVKAIARGRQGEVGFRQLLATNSSPAVVKD